MKAYIIRTKHTILAVALVLGALIALDHGWFRQTPAHAQTQGPAPGADCDKLRGHGDSAGAAACYKKLAASREPFARAEGLWGLHQNKDANDAFRDALKANDKDALRRVRWGRLFMEDEQPAEAEKLFQEALKLNPASVEAMLGMAELATESFEGQAIEYAQKALAVNPKLFEAYQIIARVHLDDNNPEKATAAANKALEISPEALDALAVLATIDMLDDKPGTQYMDRIFKINKNYGQAYALAGHFFVNNRRYDEGIAAYRKAIEIQPDLWSARAQLGVSLMRFGRDEEAKANLEACYNNGYKVDQVVNSLRLMDSYANFNTVATPTMAIKLDKKEDDLLRPYVTDQVQQAMATYEKKYKYKLTGPFRLEVFPNHDDFAVRTMGMAGIGGILGVTFGQVVAMDSPSSRPPGEFHWASTLWHEMSHVYVISMTDGRVPRWFTEGEAVYEETASHPDWGDRLTPHEIAAIKDKQLLPIAELDRGYIHPTSQEQVIVSYYQGGRVITFIVEKWGFDAILKMIDGFKNRKDTTAVIKDVLKLTPEEFDAQFIPWVEAQTKKTVDGFSDWKKRLLAISEAAKAKDWDTVISEGTAIRDVFPEYVEAGSVYEFLAEAYVAKGDKAKAMSELEKFAEVGGRLPGLLIQLSDLQAEAGHKKEAAATLDKLNWIFPESEQLHAKLGGLYRDLGNTNGEVREYRAVLASGTIDKAGGHYNLAEALHAAKRNDEALDETYLALEAAPSYKPAQKLLLELQK